MFILVQLPLTRLAAAILIALIIIGCIYCCVHCWFDLCGCCCTSAHEYEKLDQVEKRTKPPRSRHICLCWHFDKTYCARRCGRKRIDKNEERGCFGNKENWVYRGGRWTREKAKIGVGMANDKRRAVQHDLAEKRKEERRRRGEEDVKRRGEKALGEEGSEADGESKRNQRRRTSKDDDVV
jgi:hypothetical protein